MALLYAIFFGAGVTAFAYGRIGRRVGYGNTSNVTTVLAFIFVLTTIFFFTILKFFVKV